jgi:hypothetical protein
MGMNAYERHKRLINDYVRYYSKEKSFDAIFKRDTYVVRQEYQQEIIHERGH